MVSEQSWLAEIETALDIAEQAKLGTRGAAIDTIKIALKDCLRRIARGEHKL